MIKKEELRIGNFIDIDYAPATKITLDFFKAMAEGVFNEEDLNPIPITPEILEKCGFVQDGFITREFNKAGDYNFKAINHYENGFLIICNFMQGGIKLKFLHQLQNLYFALTGEELKILEHEQSLL